MPPKKGAPQLLQTSAFVANVSAITRPLTLIAGLGVIAGIVFGGYGVVLILLGYEARRSTIRFFGQSIETTSVGVACIFVGAVVVGITIHSAFKSLDKIHDR